MATAQYIIEGDHMLTSAPEAEVATYYDADGLADRIYEWLETPMGTMANHPAWGNNLGPFKFDPQSLHLEVLMEMAIASKLEKDIKGLKLIGVSVDFMEIDLCRVVIRHQFGDTVQELRL